MKKILALLLGITAIFWQVNVLAAEHGYTQAQSRAQIHTELGAAYFSRGQLGVALEELNRAIKSDARYAPAYNMMGLVYMELREFAQAEENFKQALNLDAANPEIHNNYGWFLCQQERIDEAIRHFFAALKNPLYTTPEKSYLNAGLCSLKVNNEQGAADFFLKAFKLQPQQPQALYYLGEIAYKRKDYAETKKYLLQLLQAAPAGADALWLSVRVERKLGNRDAVANYSLQLYKNFPDSLEAQALRDGNYDSYEWFKPDGQKVVK